MAREKVAHARLPALLALSKCHTPADGHCWHMLRHTFASHFMMAGGNILSLQKRPRHGDLKMTLIYARLAPDFMQSEVARMTFAAPPAADVLSLDAARGRPATSGRRQADGANMAPGGKDEKPNK